MDLWLDRHGIADKDRTAADAPEDDTAASRARRSAERRRRLWQESAEAQIDLHGLTADEAWDRLARFMLDARNAGCRKVLIIHGKGHHSRKDPAAEPVLRRTVRRFLESCPYAGENRLAEAADGGSGATWVLLKEVADSRSDGQRSR